MIHIVLLYNLAVAQPLFDLLSRHAAFFAARGSSPTDILLFVLALSVLLPSVAAGLCVAAAVVGRRTHAAVQGMVVAIAVAAIALQALRPWAALPGGALVAVAAVCGLAGAVGHARLVAVRMFLSVLSAGIVVFPAVFLLSEPILTLVVPREDPPVAATALEDPPPLIMVVFDEFPLATLMDAGGGIDAARAPSFASLAREATWFRGARSVSGDTTVAVPAILTGRCPGGASLPSAGAHPHNLFTFLGGAYALNVVETRTQMCPERLCGSRAGRAPLMDRMVSLTADAAIVYLHLLAPRDWSRWVPSIGQDWKDFAPARVRTNGTAGPGSGSSRQATGTIPPEHPQERPRQVLDFIESIRPGERPAFHFLHVLLPHVPYMWLPSGRRYGGEGPLPGLLEERWEDDGWAVMQAYQRLLLQVGFVDMLLGRLVTHLRNTGVYDRALIIVTADHGASFQPGQFRRRLTPANATEITAVPLFVKLPYQRLGRIDDRWVATIDIVPTVADVLGIAVPWPVDGRSLLADPVTTERNGRGCVGSLGDGAVSRDGEVVDPRRLLCGGAPSACPPDRHPTLVGKRVNEMGYSDASVGVVLDQAPVLRRVEPAGRFVPVYITGRILPAPPDPAPVDLAIAVNGVIAAVTRPWGDAENPGAWAALVDETVFRPGDNDVAVFLVSRLEGRPILARARAATYVLAEGDERRAGAIIPPEGALIPVTPRALRGWVDHGAITDTRVELKGWAVDTAGGRPPRTLVVFLDGTFLHAGPPHVRRPEIAAWLRNPALERSGFFFTFPLEPLRERLTDPEIRVFAISESGVASELRYVEEYPWRKRRPTRHVGDATG